LLRYGKAGHIGGVVCTQDGGITAFAARRFCSNGWHQYGPDFPSVQAKTSE
jgi:hypothetical protein